MTTSSTTDPNTITTLEPREQPPAAALIAEMEAATLAATGLDVWTRLKRCGDALACLWMGKQGDGRQPKPTEWDPTKKNLFRWESAPDIAVPLVDILVRWLVRIRAAVWQRGNVRIGPQRLSSVPGAQDPATDLAAVWQMVLDFFLYLGAWDYSYQHKLAARITEAFGYSITLVDWESTKRREKKSMGIQQLVDAMVTRYISGLPPEQQQSVDPQAIAPQIQMLVEAMLFEDEGEDLDLVQAADPAISVKEAKQVLKALRKDPAKPADYYITRDDGGKPTLRAFLPWLQCIHSADMTGTGETNLFGYPEYLDETDLRAAAAAEDWDEDALEEMIEHHKNQMYYSLFTSIITTFPHWAFNGVAIGMVPNLDLLNKTPHWCIFRVWRRIVGADGMPMVYRGVVCPFMKEHLLLWQTTDLERIPIVVDTSEPVSHAMMARGVGDIVIGLQNTIKDTLDSEGARGRLGSNPPFLRASTLWVGIKPGLEINAVMARGPVDAKANHFVEIPKVDEGALKISAEAERWAKEYYCYASTTDPDDKRLFMEDLSYASLRVMTRVLLLLWEQVQENVTEVNASRIAGQEVKLSAQRDQLQGEADVNVAFHVDGLQQDKADQFLDQLIKMMQADRTGRIDWSEAIEMAVQMRIPTYARRLLLSKQKAVEDVRNDQETRQTKIAAGIPLAYPEVQTNPEDRMACLQHWQSIPDNAPRTQTVADLIQKEAKYLQFQIEQRTTNPTTGRTGVTSNDDMGQPQQQPQAA